MKKLFLVFVAIFLLCSPSFAQNGFQPYTKPLSNEKIGETLIEFEDSNIKISRNKYDKGIIFDDNKAAIYEYLITNKSANPIILKKMDAPDRITRTEITYYLFYNYKYDSILNATSIALLTAKASKLDKFLQPLPYNYLIQPNDTTKVILLSKTYINPLVEFQFVINDCLKTVKSSAAYIVKNDKYYQTLVDSQNAKYKNMDIVGCIQNNDYYLVEAYLKTGINANKKFLGLPLLFHAIEVGNPKTIDILLKSGANPNQGFLGQHPLSTAITRKQSKIANFLFDDGTEFNLSDRLEIIKLLLDAGADPNQKEQATYPLSEAIEHVQPDIVKLLLDAGANPNQKYVMGCPLIWAIRYQQPKIVNLLLIAGADPNIKYGRKTALTYAIGNNQSEITKLLIDNGADINELKSNKSPLSSAIKKKQLKIVEYLINAGAMIDEKSIKYAQKSKDEHIKNLILSKK